jgi:putative FmdB family regulatory protein
MPTYDYLCQDCGHPFEVHSSITDYSKGLKSTCPYCGSERAIRTFTGVQVVGSRRDGGRNSSGGCGPSAGPGCCG